MLGRKSLGNDSVFFLGSHLGIGFREVALVAAKNIPWKEAAAGVDWSGFQTDMGSDCGFEIQPGQL